MSYDFYLWHQKESTSLSPGAIFALISEDLEVEELEILDADLVRDRLDEELPSWCEDEPPFQCVFADRYLAIETWRSTPQATVEWFFDLAQELGWRIFDPQSEQVDEIDLKHARDRAERERALEARRRWSEELRLLEKRAEAGEAVAQCEIGNRFAFGEGVREDPTRAFDWYLRAAENGSFDAMFNVAACYQRGDGVEQDLAAALRWYERASDEDKMLATFALGEIYMDGIAIPADKEKAAEYFRVSLENGHPDAASALKLLQRGNVTEDDKRRFWKYWTRE